MPEVLESQIHANAPVRRAGRSLLWQRLALVGVIIGVWWLLALRVPHYVLPGPVRVWEALLKIPMGRAVSYTDIARYIGSPSASRAVGSAVGRNPISFVVPCHRVLRGDGSLGGYHWGLTRKRALIGWETGRVAAGRG